MSANEHEWVRIRASVWSKVGKEAFGEAYYSVGESDNRAMLRESAIRGGEVIA